MAITVMVDTTKRDSEIANDYTAKGFTLEEIGSMAGLSKERIGQILDEQGVRRRSASDYAKIRQEEKYGADFTDRVRNSYMIHGRAMSVARELNAPRWRVNDAIASLGADFRNAYRQDSGRKAKYSPRDLIDAVQRATRDVGEDGCISSTRYGVWAESHDEPRLHTLLGRLGHWENVCNAAGVKPSKSKAGRRPKFGFDACVDAIIDVAHTIGHLPTIEEYADNRGEPSAATVQRVCIGWNNALREAFERMNVNGNG